MTYGRICYDAYVKARGGIDGAGQPMPDWQLLPSSARLAWERAAEEVRKVQ